MNEAEESKNSVDLQGEKFVLVLERRRGVAIYTNADKSKYLRIGAPHLVDKELVFHKELLTLGFPVARILAEGKLEADKYWIEESLGTAHFGSVFKEETRSAGTISEQSLTALISIVKRVHDAQERHTGSPVDIGVLAQGVQYERLIAEMPSDEKQIRQAWDKMHLELSGYPSCVTHGDLTAHNIMPGGVIDFGDHFIGPLGFDMINCITTPFWFPNDEAKNDFGHRSYSYVDKHVDRFFEAVGSFSGPNGIIELKKYFDAIFLLKAWWWTVGNDDMPKLQAWRYQTFRTLVHRYLADESLYDYWLEHKDD